MSDPILDLWSADQAWGQDDPAHGLTAADSGTLATNACTYLFGSPGAVATALGDPKLKFHSGALNPGVLWCWYTEDDQGTNEVKIGAGQGPTLPPFGDGRVFASPAFANEITELMVDNGPSYPGLTQASARNLLTAALGRSIWQGQTNASTSSAGSAGSSTAAPQSSETPTDTSAPAPAPASVPASPPTDTASSAPASAGIDVTADTDVTDVAGYKYHLTLTAHLNDMTTDIANAPPGRTALIVTGTASGTVTNENPGRDAPDTFASYIPSAGTLDSLWPADGIVCSSLTPAATYTMTVNGKRSRFCDIETFSFLAAGGLDPGGTAQLPGGIFVNFASNNGYQVDEAKAPAIVEAFNAGPTVWFWNLGVGAATTPASVQCGTGFGGTLVLWASQPVQDCASG